jgi:ABC-2 type transport system ATP-binding protein
MANIVLEVTSLTKLYGGFTAVNDISFSIKEGEIVGLLGPNGAGKTTTIQMLLALTTPTAGTISYFGKDLRTHREEILARINYVSAFSGMQSRVTVRENLQVFAGLYEVDNWKKRVDILAATLGITKKLDSLYWNLSSGEKARVNLVKAFLNEPQLILMDEPTASLDPEIVNVVLDLVADMRKRKHVAILYTSHNMGEVSRICDRVMFLHHGKIIATDTPLGLSRRVGTAVLRLTFDGEQKPVTDHLRLKKYVHELVAPHIVEIEVDEADIPKVLFGLGKKHVWITDIEIEKPDLEDVFLAVAKGGPDALLTD